jgi:preprotein translocase subunit YajC
MGPEQAAAPGWVQFIPFLIIFGIFYFLILKPQQDKQKQHKETLKSLKKNDQVVTIGGIHGTIVNVKEKTVTVRIDDNVKIDLDKESISLVKRKSQKNEPRPEPATT